MPAIAKRNSFVVRFANVNGTGSASANAAVAKTIFRMGHRVGAKNMFPSNIQGMPTWYEIRVDELGFTGRKGNVDLMMAMNPQTLSRDTKKLAKDAFVLYDSSAYLPKEQKRDDLSYLELPACLLARDEFKQAKIKPLLQNMIYVGALIPLLNLDRQILIDYINEQFSGKSALLPFNIRALEMGEQYASCHFPCPLPFYLDHCKRSHEAQIMIDGNTAAALACLYAGASICAWYPITPSTSVAEKFASFCEEHRVDRESGQKKYVSLQAEDEIAAIGMVLGASWNGARAFTATSGPGISLMSEFLGYAYYAEIPAVVLNIQRCGPATGMPTRNQQADLLACAYASHGDTCHLLLFPSDPGDCFEYTAKAFDLAERFQTPVIVMSDLEIGMNEYVTPEIIWDDRRAFDRGKVLNQEQLEKLDTPFARYDDPDQDGVCYRTYPGGHKNGAAFTRGSGHDRLGRYTEDPELYSENMERIKKKFQTAIRSLPEPEIKQAEDHRKDVCLAYYGSSAEALREVSHILYTEYSGIDTIRLTAFPFSIKVEKFLREYSRCIIIEQNRDGQMLRLLRAELGLGNLEALCSYDGLPLEANHMVDLINEKLG